MNIRRNKLFHFLHYPYMKINLRNINFPTHLTPSFHNSYNNLLYDQYIPDKTRMRRYAHYKVDYSTVKNYDIKFIPANTFAQNVPDSRKEERVFSLIENPNDPFIMEFIKLNCTILMANRPFKKLSIDLHQVRQITYPGIISHNSLEGIHQDGADYIVSACVLNRFNIKGGVSSIYNINKDKIYETKLKKYDFIFQDDKSLFHYVTPVEYYESDGFERYGFRDILGIDIKIEE